MVVASDDMIDNNPDSVREFVAFINAASTWSNDNRVKAGSLLNLLEQQLDENDELFVQQPS